MHLYHLYIVESTITKVLVFISKIEKSIHIFYQKLDYVNRDIYKWSFIKLL